MVLAEMFTENTGRALCDSGDAYGRNWERNQGKFAEDFLTKPDVEFHVWGGEFDYVTINTFKHLSVNLEFDSELQDEFEEFSKDSDDYWLYDAERFAQTKVADGRVETFNSYNYDTLLDETIQWVEYMDEYGDYIILLQYHGGADVRGGYTKPRVFRVLDDRFGNFDAELFCTNSNRATTLDGRDVAVCGIQVYTHGTDMEVFTDGDYLSGDIQFAVSDDGVVLCPKCGSPFSGTIPTY